MFIRRQWYAALPSSQLTTKPVGVVRFGQKLVLFRDVHGAAVCLPDRCRHRLAQLSRGRVRDGCIECPYHGVRYDGSGRSTLVPWTTTPPPPSLALTPLPCREARGLIWVWNGELDDALPDLPWDDALHAELHADGRDCALEAEFDVPFQRVMENLTDLTHLPFVHRTSMPVGNALRDYACEVDGVHVRVRGEMAGGKTLVRGAMHVVAPFVGLLHFGDAVRFLAIATPIDATHTWLYARYVQDFVTWPLVGRAITKLLGLFDYKLLQVLQDAPVWRSQHYEAPDDLRDCHLLPGDAGIAAYFRLHARLLKEGHERPAAGDRLHRGEAADALHAR